MVNLPPATVPVNQSGVAPDLCAIDAPTKSYTIGVIGAPSHAIRSSAPEDGS